MTPDEVPPPENSPPRPTRRTTGILAAVLLAVVLATGASSAQASSHKLTLRQVKTAIGHYAGEVGMNLEREAAKEGQQHRLTFSGASLHDCETHEGGGLCLVQWHYMTGEHVTCVGWVGVLPTKKIVNLSKMKCAATSNNEQTYGG
jgi:hypothetical protein